MATNPNDLMRFKIDLIKTKVEILKLKANDHDWHCYTPESVKKEMEDALVVIDTELAKIEELNKEEK